MRRTLVTSVVALLVVLLVLTLILEATASSALELPPRG
jgi:hypothetical protein